MENIVKEITIKEIDCAYETLERVLNMGGMESIKERLWQNFSGQATGATMTGAEILRKMGNEASAKEIYNYYRDVVGPKFEKLFDKILNKKELNSILSEV